MSESPKTKRGGRIAKYKTEPHSLSGTWVQNVWTKMMDRCYNPKVIEYKNYGERGIKVCDRWKLSMTNFHADMGDRPTSAHTLDRIDNNGDYCPENCRWATWKEQANNRRNSRLIEYEGEFLTASQWSDRFGVPRTVITQRIDKYGWSVEKALKTPKSLSREWKLSRK